MDCQLDARALSDISDSEEANQTASGENGVGFDAVVSHD
jgi:hypothetical protein